MQKRLMLIVNPAAGRGGYKQGFGEALRILYEGGYTPTVFFTAGQGDATRIASNNAANFDLTVCIGGDGTLSEVMGGLMQAEKPCTLGYIPMGTANDVATTLGLPKNNPAEAARRLLNGTAHPYDVGLFDGDKYFAYIAAFGAFTEVSYATPQDKKRRLGHLAYVLEGMAALGKIESYNAHIEYDGGVIDTRLVYGSMSNSTSVAGIVKLREDMVGLGDGMSELVLVKDPGSIEGLGEIAAGVLSQRYDSEKLIILHTKRAKFTFDKPVAWTRDGEAGGEYESVTLKNIAAPLSFVF